jgi:hypothetical protein
MGWIMLALLAIVAVVGLVVGHKDDDSTPGE